jgi:hypothetical protein
MSTLPMAPAPLVSLGVLLPRELRPSKRLIGNADMALAHGGGRYRQCPIRERLS